MDSRAGLTYQPPEAWQRLTVIDSHTGGEPFRVVVDGLPDIPGATVLEKRSFARENLDELRRALMFEPRGHTDMYGGWIGPPVTPGSDLSVLFTHNEGFSTMCGHGIIALAKVVLDTGIVDRPGERPELVIDTPAGVVTATARRQDGRVVELAFRNVPSFATHLGESVFVDGVGEVVFDLAFGGAFYAFVDETAIPVDRDDVGALVDAAGRIKKTVAESVPIEHPDHPDLGFLYGVIFTGPSMRRDLLGRHMCVFAEGEVDRSPTGTGVSARLALLHARGAVGIGDMVRIESVVGSVFSGRIVELADIGGIEAVIPEVFGRAHIIGRSEFWFDPDDDLGRGFLVRGTP